MATAVYSSEEEQVGSGSPEPDLVSELASTGKGVFSGDLGTRTESLQNLLDSLTVRVVGVAFEVFREEYDNLTRLLRNAYGQMARFVKGDFRKDASFYLGQLHALTEITHRLGHQRVPRGALEFAARSRVAKDILRKTAQERSIGAGALARELGIAESNLSAVCKPLVQKELLRRDRFGKRVRYSATPLTFAVVAELTRKTAGKADEKEEKSARPKVTSAAEKTTENWPEMPVAATVSLKPGSGPAANADDFVNGLLTLAAVQGGKGITIEPSGRYILLDASEKRNHPELTLPASVSKPLREQLKDWSSIEWNGQKLVVEPSGTSFKLEFVKNPDPQKSKTKARVDFQEIQRKKKRFEDLEKIYMKALNIPETEPV
jgi:DNA-binding MarR family transcriptional regulator